MPDHAGDVTELLDKLTRGDKSALDRLLPLVYAELRALAASHFRGERGDHTLQPTALVHEAYLRLANARFSGFEARAQFFGMAATVMRRILVDHGREKAAAKRGGHRTTLKDTVAISATEIVDGAAIAQALDRLEAEDADLCRVAELRFFGGFSVEETAELLSVSTPTVKRRWSVARAWLARELRPREPGERAGSAGA